MTGRHPGTATRPPLEGRRRAWARFALSALSGVVSIVVVPAGTDALAADALAAGVPLRDGRLVQPLAPGAAVEAFSEPAVASGEAARADAAPAASTGAA